jgi:hypothetical protein
MILLDLLTKTIDIGIEAAKRDYAGAQNSDKLHGSISGFNACQGKAPAEIAALLGEANRTTIEKHREQALDYWYWRCRAAEIEWVANVISAVLVNQGQTPIVPPTARGVMFAAKVMEQAA